MIEICRGCVEMGGCDKQMMMMPRKRKDFSFTFLVEDKR